MLWMEMHFLRTQALPVLAVVISNEQHIWQKPSVWSAVRKLWGSHMKFKNLDELISESEQEHQDNASI